MFKIKRINKLWIGLILVISLIFLFVFTAIPVSAQTLVGDTVDATHEFSRYPLLNYSLDFYVDNSGNWLPWNWGRGVGNAVMIGLFYLTNVIWSLTVMLAFATGYVVQEAYNLDFISTTAEAIGQNIQTLAGVSHSGINGGFFGGFLLIFILILGIYIAYVGLLKRETTKAFKATLNFLTMFVISSLIFVSAPTLIRNVNDLSRDLSTEALRIGTNITLPNSEIRGSESTALIRNNLFSIQIIQPWKALQFGSTGIADYRIDDIRTYAPSSSARQEAIEREVEQRNNTNMSVEGLPSRLGTVLFLLFFNLGISAFVLLLSGMMIFSQVLFIVYAMFLPISFVLSMIPTFEGMSKKAIINLFNVVMMRAGLTLVVTVAFSIATMLYVLAGQAPLFMIMFLQITTFAGIYMNLGKIMGMFSLQSNDSQNLSKNMTRNVQRSISRGRQNVKKAVIGGLVGGKVASRATKRNQTLTSNRSNTNLNAASKKQTVPQTEREKTAPSKKIGQTIGKVVDTPSRMMDKAKQTVDEVKQTPTTLKYAVHQGKRSLVDGASELTNTIGQTKESQQQQRQQKRMERIKLQAMKQSELKNEGIKRRQAQGKETTDPSQGKQTPIHSIPTEKLTKQQLRQRQQLARNAYETKKQKQQPNKVNEQPIQELMKQPRTGLTKQQLRQRQQETQKMFQARKQNIQLEGSQKLNAQELLKQPREKLTKNQLRQRQQLTRQAIENRKQQLQSTGNKNSLSQQQSKLSNIKKENPQIKNRTSNSIAIPKENRKIYPSRKEPSLKKDVIRQIKNQKNEKIELKNKMVKNPAKKMKPTREKIRILKTVQSGQMPRKRVGR